LAGAVELQDLKLKSLNPVSLKNQVVAVTHAAATIKINN
jgi:hypothetical protein